MKRLVPYLIPSVMTIVLMIQLLLVELYQLDRWKGMGMGMFSGIHDRNVDRLELQVDGVWVDALDDVYVNTEVSLIEMRQFPTEGSETRLLHALQRDPHFATSSLTDIYVEVGAVTTYDETSFVVTKETIYASLR